MSFGHLVHFYSTTAAFHPRVCPLAARTSPPCAETRLLLSSIILSTAPPPSQVMSPDSFIFLQTLNFNMCPVGSHSPQSEGVSIIHLVFV